MKEFPFLLYKTEKEDIYINALIKDDSILFTTLSNSFKAFSISSLLILIILIDLAVLNSELNSGT